MAGTAPPGGGRPGQSVTGGCWSWRFGAFCLGRRFHRQHRFPRQPGYQPPADPALGGPGWKDGYMVGVRVGGRNNVWSPGARTGRWCCWRTVSAATRTCGASWLPAGRGYRVVLFDHIGAGRSDLSAWRPRALRDPRRLRRRRAEALPRAGPADVVFVGHSVSAMIGVLAANREPDRFASWCCSPRRRATSTRRLPRRVQPRRHRRAARVAGQQLPGLVGGDGAGDHGQPGPPGAGRGADEQLLPHRSGDRAGRSPGPRSCPTTAPTWRRSPCRR